MYLDHFGLERKPFRITTDPAFLWLGEKHREALAALTYGVQAQKGFLVLTGEVGSGKTTLINALREHLGREVVVGVVTDPRMEPLDLLNAVAAAFGLPTRYASKAMLLGDLRRFLELVNGAGQTALLIVDEAQRLDGGLMEEVRLLSNMEWRHRKLLTIFFVGQPELMDLLSRPENRAILQRVALHHRLPFLSLEETAEMIRHRMRQAGASRPVFNLDAFPPIQTFSQGAPRLINIVCDHALLTAYVQGRKAVSADVVEECAASLMLPGEAPALPLAAPLPPVPGAPAPAAPAARAGMPPAPVRLRRGLALAAVALLAACGGFYAAGALRGDRGLPSVALQPLVASESVRIEPVRSPAPEAPVTPAALPEGDFGHALPEETSAPAATAPAASHAALASPARAPGPAAVRATPEASAPASKPPAPVTPATAPPAPAAAAPAAVAPPERTAPARTEAAPPPLPAAPAASARLAGAEPAPAAVPAVPPASHAALATPAPAAARAPGPAAVRATPEASAPASKPPAPVTPATAPPAPAAAAPVAAGLPTLASLPAAAAPLPEDPSLLREKRLLSFLADYCEAYEAMDLERFAAFFTPDAREKGVPIREVMPRYRDNFARLETLDYRIRMGGHQGAGDGAGLELKGDFVARYRLKEGGDWRESRGRISMEVVEEAGSGFRVRSLDYEKE